ncbi:LPXTG cell wall anchor domain-containing protein [Micromonospora sp. STR1_7]|uniref:LPXTG cell wall anchor domain-containing protein n=1 Tax=Micromonospora parastrephiae TaxID=2806101 RepID=A0ABS1XS24_9ACTN|nr:LPXTG cell wall anchor domain-containing protein [Micromonospora parastrephiae]MBM0232060.1 LPXTG cell wall anchor domain-containing protein [Micromonospora parastrephiae]
MAKAVGRSVLVGGILAAVAGLVFAVSPMLIPDAASLTAVAAVQAAPSAGTDVIFEVLSASPSASPTMSPTVQPTPPPTHPTPEPTHSHLPVTGDDGGFIWSIAGLGGGLLLLGWLLVARRSRPS